VTVRQIGRKLLVLRDLIHDADTLYWDLDNEGIIFGKID
jgi:hypothetical protein